MDILAERRARDAERKRRKRAEEREKRLSAPVSSLRPSEEGSPACEMAPERTETAQVTVIPDNVVEDTIDAFDAFAMLKARREKEYGR